MKILISCVLLAAAVISLEAAPARPAAIQLYKAEIAEKLNVKDIWSDCSSSSDPAKLVNLTITPDPPKKGVTLSLTAVVTLNEQVTKGEIEIDLKILFIPIKQTTELCDSVTCPVNTGTQTLTISQSIPSAAPSGHYTGKAYVRDQNGKELICIALDFHM